MPQHEVIADDVHRMTGIGSVTRTLDPHYEYRWVFDRKVDLWRLDVRVHAEQPD